MHESSLLTSPSRSLSLAIHSVPLTPYPCRNCSRVIFCSRKCERTAHSSHHALECSLIPFIWKSGLSGICYISLRILVQNGEKFFEKIQDLLENKVPNDIVIFYRHQSPISYGFFFFSS